jgi:hypothetical protein
VVTLIADRRGDLHVHNRTAAQRAPEVPGRHLTIIGKLKQRVAAEHRPRRRTPIRTPKYRASRRYSSISSLGSMTAATPAS